MVMDQRWGGTIAIPGDARQTRLPEVHGMQSRRTSSSDPIANQLTWRRAWPLSPLPATTPQFRASAQYSASSEAAWLDLVLGPTAVLANCSASRSSEAA